MRRIASVVDPDAVADGPDVDGSTADEPDVEHDDGRVAPALRLLGWVFAVVVSVALVRVLLVQSFVIPSVSMEPTLRVGDRVLVSRLDTAVRRGDVVVFDGRGVFDALEAEPSSPLATAGRAVAGALGAPAGRSDYVKRVVGLPGERVTCCDAEGRVTVDGRPLDERYVARGDSPSDVRFDVVVPTGRLFVMGDHRSDSGDSRAHLGDPGGGTVPVDNVVGRVVAVWWPLGRAERVHRGSQGMP
jgi:signal peptidase I